MILRYVMTLVALALWPMCATAQELAPPQGRILLTVTGTIGTTNHEDAAAFDLDMLRDLGAETFETTTIWTDGPQTFEGVTLLALLQTLGVSDGELRISAVNDYSIDLPVDEALSAGPLIAWSRNGQIMTLRDKGPLWLVYPYDADTAYQSEVTYARSVWQLDRIEVLRP